MAIDSNIGDNFLAMPEPHHHVSRLMVLVIILIVVIILGAVYTFFFTPKTEIPDTADQNQITDDDRFSILNMPSDIPPRNPTMTDAERLNILNAAATNGQ